MADPAPAGIDEPAHLTRAEGIANGQLFGATPPGFVRQGYVSDQTTRLFRVPLRIAYPYITTCMWKQPQQTGACTDAPSSGDTAPPQLIVTKSSYIGAYEPTLYLLPASLIRFASTTRMAVRIGRLGALLVATTFITLAAAQLSQLREAAVVRAGLLLALTPTVVFLNAVLNPNGGEIALAICFASSVIRIGVGPVRAPRWVWAVFGVSGALLGVSRSLGLVWVMAGLLLGVALARGRLAEIARASPWAGLTALTTVGVGLAADLAWWAREGRPHIRIPLSDAVALLPQALARTPGLLKDQVGLFGWVDTRLDPVEYGLWGAGLLLLFTAALVAGRWPERGVLGVAAAGGVMALLGLTVSAPFLFGYGLDGAEARYSLPISVMAVLVAGVMAGAGRTPRVVRGARITATLISLATSLGQFAAYWLNARRYAVGTHGPFLFPGHSVWRPPLGWLPWTVLALAGAILMAVSVLAEPAFRDPDDRVAVPA